ncbi:MAG: SPFH domain-containing protein [Chloroflexota bacterium]
MLSRIAPYLVVILVILFIFGNQIFFIVDEPEQAIVLQFGEPIRTITEPGLSLKTPFVQNVLFFDKRILSSDADAQEYLTTDKKRLVVDHVTRWRIIDPLEFYKSVRTERGARARLDEFVFSGLREELALVPFNDVITAERENIISRVTESSANKAVSLGVEVVDVRIKRADLPEDVEQSVFDRMRAERQRESSLFRAEGEEQANIIRAQADRDATVIAAEGYQQSQVIRGEGEAEAIKIYAEALGQDLEFYAFSRRLEAYGQSLKPGDSLVIPSDSEFFRYLIEDSQPPTEPAIGGVEETDSSGTEEAASEPEADETEESDAEATDAETTEGDTEAEESDAESGETEASDAEASDSEASEGGSGG